RVVVITSVYGREAGGAPAYNAAKAAEISLEKSLAREVAAKGVTVNGVAPGSILWEGGGWHRRQQAHPDGIADFLRREMPPVDFARSWLLEHRYAAAGSSYSSTGWALEDAFEDQIALLDYFSAHVGKPRRVIAWGASLGGIITAGLVQLHPDRFAAAMPLCGVLSGGIATWNAELDSAYAFKALLAPSSSLQLTHITDADSNRQLATQLFNAAAATLQGRARLALV